MLRVWLVVVTHCCTIMESGLSTVVASDSEPATAGGGAWRQWQDWNYTDYEVAIADWQLKNANLVERIQEKRDKARV